MNNLQIHGGEGDTYLHDFINSEIENETNENKNSKIKSKNTCEKEINKLDSIVSNNIEHPSKLDNDIRLTSELKISQDSVDENKEVTPVTFTAIRKGKRNRKVFKSNLRTLLDSGSSDSIIRKGLVAEKPHKWKKSVKKFNTAGGEVSTEYVTNVNFNLTEFSESKIINWKFNVSENSNDLGYDMIIGRDLMVELGLIINFKDKKVSWEGIDMPMRDFNQLRKLNLSRREMRAVIQASHEPIVTEEATKRMIKILDSNYKKADLAQVAAGAKHLTKEERSKLYNLLMEYEDLFDGTLGEWKSDPVDFELVDGAKPHSQRHYPVPHLYKKTFKKELDRLVKLGVLEVVQQSEWGSPTFIVPKKDDKVRFVSDFRRLNAKLKRKPYPLPRISDTLQQLEGFQYATSLDLNMGYYHIVLSPEAADMCTIITEFGKFRYKRLPMGVACSPDIFQAKIYELLGDIEGTKAYIDDILVIKRGTFDEHLEQLKEIFRRCRKAGLKINAEKCRFGLNEIDYLGYIVTPEGVKPNPKKIKAIQDLERPTTVTEVRRLIGMVQYYRDLWRRRSHILQPFTEISAGKKKAKIKWTPELEKAFLEIKKMISKETLLTYPDWSKPFEIHTDASDYQLGAVISQGGKPIAFFSRKLNKAQRNYTTTEKELLSIVECVKEFRNILFGYPIKVYSDHKNLVHAATISQSQRVMRWRLILEEFGPDIRHIKGEENIVADAMSRLPTANKDQKEHCTEVQDLKNELFATNAANNILDEDDERFPLELPLVQREQNKELKRNPKLQTALKDKQSGFTRKLLDNVDLIFYEERIYVPKRLRNRTINWYHHFLCHPGEDRLYKTMKKVCFWKGMTSQIKRHCKLCKICQEKKSRKRKYGKLPPKIVEPLEPWKTVHIDLVGPYTIDAKQMQPDGSIIPKTYSLTCMTFIDPATGWFEIAEVPHYDLNDLKLKIKSKIDKTSARISQLFNQTWLSRYPRPSKVIFDNGSEFKKDFLPLLKDFAIKAKPTTIKNPQSNGAVERIHQVLTNMLNTKNLTEQVFDIIDPWGEILSSIAWAIRASNHSTLEATPAQLVFGRDMIFNLKSLINWKALSIKKQKITDLANARENLKRLDHDYSIGDRVYIVRDKIHRKMDGPKTGPFPITEIFTNGTVRIQRGSVNERINIRRLEPHFE